MEHLPTASPECQNPFVLPEFLLLAVEKPLWFEGVRVIPVAGVAQNAPQVGNDV